MKYLIGFVLGVLLTILAYERDTATQLPTEQLVDKVTEQVAEIDYTFYDNLSQSSISVIQDAYNATLKKSDPSTETDVPKFYYVQIGAFSKENNADSFRAKALLEGYLSADIFIESTKTASLGKFRTSIDQIEKVTGIDFFAGLEDKIEHRIESQVSTMW